MHTLSLLRANRPAGSRGEGVGRLAFFRREKSFKTDIYDASNGFKRAVVPKTGSYSLVDLSGYWNPTPNLRLQMGVRNLLDKKYWDHQDILRLAKFDQLDEKAGYAQPGRAFFAALNLSF